MEEKANPLFMGATLYSILEYLPISDILNCRLVCRSWNKTSVTILRQVKTIKFRMRLEYVEDYTQLMRNSLEFPYSRYELEFYHMNDQAIQAFLTLAGTYITSLQLNNCRCTTTELFHILQVQLPHLKSFSINCDPIENTGRLQHQVKNHEDGDDKSAVAFSSPPPQLKSLSLVGMNCRNEELLIDLFTFCPSLNSLTIRCYDILDDFSEFEQLCFSIFLSDQYTPCAAAHLETLKIEFRMKEEHLEGLWKKKLEKLKFLHINLDDSVSCESLLKLLSSYSASLTKLDLDFKLEVPPPALPFPIPVEKQNGNRDHPPQQEHGEDSQVAVVPAPSAASPIPSKQYYNLPKMISLSRLTLSNFKGSLSFLNDCEKLRHLALFNCDVSATSLQGVVIHPHLHTFICTTKLGEVICLQLAQLFPHLKELNTELDETTVKVVFDRMSELEELVICGDQNQITDDVITGIKNIFEIMTIYDSMHEQHEHPDGFDHLDDELRKELPAIGGDPHLLLGEQIPGVRVNPSITKLKHLRKIKIHDASAMTDASVRYGIVFCKKLVEISFLNSHVTDGSLESIANNLTYLAKLELLSDIPKFTPVGRSYIRNKLPACDLILGQMDLQYLYRQRQFGCAETGAITNKVKV